MLRGGFQYGRKMTYSICSTKIGVRWSSDWPTTTFIRSGSSPVVGSVAHIRKSATLTKTLGRSLSVGSQRIRSIDSSIWRIATASDTLSARMVPGPMTPSASRPWRRWKRLTASTTAPP